MKSPANLRTAAAWVGLLLLVVAAYSNSFEAEYHLDDLQTIKENRWVATPAPGLAGLWDAFVKGPAFGRPVGNATFALATMLFGREPAGQHFVNLLVHLWTTAALGLLVFLTLTEAGFPQGKGRREIALLAAGLWALSPVQTQGVTYVVQRYAALVAALGLSSLILYVLARRGASRLLLLPSALLYLLALGCKEVAVLLPPTFILYEILVLGGGRGKSAEGKTAVRPGWVKLYLAFLVSTMPLAGAFYLAADGGAAGYARMVAGGEAMPKRDFNAAARVLSQGRVILLYLSLLLFPDPSRLTVEHDLGHSTGLFSPPPTLPAWLLVVLAAVYAARVRKKRPLLSLGIACFLVNLALEASFLNLELVFEHRLYIPSLALFPLCAAFLQKTMTRLPTGWRRGVPWAAFLLLAFLSHQRNRAWRTEVSLWDDAARKAPGKARAWNNLGAAHEVEGRRHLAGKYYARALAIDPGYGEALYNMGNYHWERKELEEARRYWERALEIDFHDHRVYMSLGNYYTAKGNVRRALELYEESLQYGSFYGPAYHNMAALFLRAGEPEKAAEALRRAIELGVVPRARLIESLAPYMKAADR